MFNRQRQFVIYPSYKIRLKRYIFFNRKKWGNFLITAAISTHYTTKLIIKVL